MKIATKDAAGNVNGHLIPIWNLREKPFLRPDQVYVTIVLPGCVKGPHLHKKRRGFFCCIKGNVRIVQRTMTGEYLTEHSGDDHKHAGVFVPPGHAAAIYNDGPEEAIVLNMPAPSWAPDDQDEWPVEGWDPK